MTKNTISESREQSDSLLPMTIEQLAALLADGGDSGPLLETIRRHGEAGAPVRTKMVGLVEYAAWLVRHVQKRA